MKSDMDNREWLDDYSALKQVNPNNPFTVPFGYFDELEQQITSYVHLQGLKADNEGFTVPANYFNELNANIQSRIAIEEMAGEEDGFAVPEGYFENLEQQISARIRVEEALQEAGEFAVPEGYFENLEQQIGARIMVEEAMQEADQFAVPAGYFENLSKNILDKTVNEVKVKQDKAVKRGVVRKMFATTAFKYAAAACFAVVVGGTVLLTQPVDPNAEHNNSFLHKQVSTLPVSDIQTYLQEDVDANDTQHAVIDENTPVNDAKLDNALKSIDDGTNQ